ncbi:MAG: alpha/beta hydrolase [Candidatus Eremiobacteraeota bacterium]|nr:alpha/beta hydrolase [Candidatus Eremiobacteraeota bacterium]
MDLLLVPALLLTLLCIWIVIPPSNGLQIILTVASIELSPYLWIINGALFGIVFFRKGRFARASALCAALNVVLCTIPIAALWTSPAASTLEPQTGMHAVRTVSIPVKLGDEDAMILAYLPQTGDPAPIVFAIYGGAWQRGSPKNDAVLNQTLARAGYAVFALEYRHAPRYHFPAALDDVRGEIALIRQNAVKYHADPSRIAVLGHSSGGELAELIAFEPHSPVRALVSFSGAIDLAKGYYVVPQPDPIDVRGVIADYLGATPPQAPSAYRAASPIMQVRSGLPPALLIYGTRDHVVDIRYAWKFRGELRARGNEVRFLELPWTEHAFEDVPYGLHAPVAFRAVLAFLNSRL